MADRYNYTLRHPIVVEHFDAENPHTPRKVTIETLSLAKRVKGRHMRHTDGAAGPVQFKLWLFASLAGISRDEVDELDSDDVEAIDALYEDGFPLDAGAGLSTDGQATGQG